MFKKFVGKIIDGIEVREANDMLSRLRSLDSPEVAVVTALVYHHGSVLEGDLGFDPFLSADLLRVVPDASLRTSNLAISIRKEGDILSSNALAVWVHTFRAMVNFEVRNIVREIWRELQRGTPFVEAVANDFYSQTRQHLALGRLGEIPSTVHFNR